MLRRSSRKDGPDMEVSPISHDETDPDCWPTPALEDTSFRLSYRIARGEQGVLTFEPYKSILLPHWRFRTCAIAKQSSQTLYNAFQFYVAAGDLVGADMARKFIQMGMTRAKRYANHKGGRKYEKQSGSGDKVELPRSEAHEGRKEKLAASEVFREVWTRCSLDDRYRDLKEEFGKEVKAWEKEQRKGNVKGESAVKIELKEVEAMDSG